MKGIVCSYQARSFLQCTSSCTFRIFFLVSPLLSFIFILAISRSHRLHTLCISSGMYHTQLEEHTLSICGRLLLGYMVLLVLASLRQEGQNVMEPYPSDLTFSGVYRLLSGIWMLEVESETHFSMVLVEKVREQLASFVLPILPISFPTVFASFSGPYSTPYRIF